MRGFRSFNVRARDIWSHSLAGRRRPSSVQSVCVCVCVCMYVYTTWHVDTYLSALCQPVSGVPCRRHLGELDFSRVNLSTYIIWTGWRRPMLVLQAGTCCLTISRTSIFLNKFLNVILRHSVRLILAHSARLRFLIKTHYINLLLLYYYYY